MLKDNDFYIFLKIKALNDLSKGSIGIIRTGKHRTGPYGDSKKRTSPPI